ncbi:hypothetical protein VTK73DRAFT_2788 [Phialemonium thermophilum]|uniref:Uncharacterized protein n=1 Tax=Phialemonium thermophilum TaxID=223376 RepID=A0ABR3VPY8_9PEZI
MRLFLASLFSTLLSTWLCAAAPGPLATITSDLPASCTEKPVSCYTRTHTTSSENCPRINCPMASRLICPMYISITSLPVPCSTDCCPSTPTHYVTHSCVTTCPTACVIPTETVEVTTGCPATPTPTGRTWS